MRLTKRGLVILKSFIIKNNVQIVANKVNIVNKILRSNYIKHYLEMKYLKNAGKDCYILTKKGKNKIKETEDLPLIDILVLNQVKIGTKYIKMLYLIKKEYGKQITQRALYTRVSRLRKKHKIKDRRKVEYKLPKTITLSLAELLGLLFSDGYINHRYICFYNKDNILIKRFQLLMRKVFHLENQLVRKKSSGATELSYSSNDVAEYINNLIAKKRKIPENIITGNKSVKKCFLRGYFSGDGCIVLSIAKNKLCHNFQIKGFLYLACRRKKITLLIGKILSSLGYSPNICSQGLRLNKMEDIKKFYKQIGFIDHATISTHSKYWKGYEKNQLLKYVSIYLKSDNTLKDLAYKSKEDVVKHIHTKLEKFT